MSAACLESIMKTILRACAILLLMATVSAKAADVNVFAAASLTDALKEIAATYEKSSGDKILFNFASSGTLAIQIKAGGPADIFFSADELKMNDVAKQGLIVVDSRKDLLGNTLVIVIPADSSATLTSATQLAGDNFKKIALGQTKSVPAGIYAKEYLQKIGIWDKVAPRVIPSENVRAALGAVESGNVDAGIVYKTDALSTQNVKIAFEVPAAEGPSIVYPVALLKGGPNAGGAKKFLDYLEQPDSLKTFAKYGFIPKG
jgi:molybdate transport system substrate-binding protein